MLKMKNNYYKKAYNYENFIFLKCLIFPIFFSKVKICSFKAYLILLIKSHFNVAKYFQLAFFPISKHLLIICGNNLIIFLLEILNQFLLYQGIY